MGRLRTVAWSWGALLVVLLSGCVYPTRPPSEGGRPRADTASFRFVGRVEHPALTEVSGVARAPGGRGSFWVHNDSGDLPRLFEVLPGESVVRIVSLADARAVDWEDVDVAPCEPEQRGRCLYVADVGDNDARRSHVAIYRVPLGTLSISLQGGDRVLSSQWDRVRFRYPDGPRNAEALLVHPRTLQMYVIEKRTAAEARLYRVPRGFGRGGEVRRARRVGTMALPDSRGSSWTITGGDFAPDGRTVSLLAPEGVLTLCVAYDDVAAFDLEAEVVPGPRVPMPKPEGLTYVDDRTLVATGEGRRPPFYRLRPYRPCGDAAGDSG